MKKCLLVTLLLIIAQSINAVERERISFNGNWLMQVGDVEDGQVPGIVDRHWQPITLPRAWNEDEAFSIACAQLSDTIVWYRKHFNIDETAGRKFFIEFEGVRFGADVWLNGHYLGLSENGVMAFGFDLTPYIVQGENVLAVRTDNSWNYHERSTGSTFQWNNKNFNANYGGIPKNVWFHTTGLLYQTLPLYSNLGTTGTYVYATDFNIANHKATIHVESQVKNDDTKERRFFLTVVINDADGNKVAGFNGDTFITLQPGETGVVKAAKEVQGLHFWSWGYGYLYTVETYLRDKLKTATASNDLVITRTGFRKTRFAEGKIWLNDRVIMMHGYAQRTSNEWPGVGMSVPAWLSDYSNRLQVESGGNLVRWMHVTPWKQDIESCDRVGLIQAMPAGDAEKDVEGRRWEQRVDLMRDAIIYNRNNPSILFYEGGNESISRNHMLELKAVRDQYDPFGGRAIGSREMLDIDEAEYGGEMLYVNKSAKHPMWQMEYCRDEGLRKYWDAWSYPYHKEGAGPLYRNAPAPDYNHNMDAFAVEMVRRWYDYWLERPGTGRRVNSGGAKIVFSDTNTHFRGESNYRTSGVTDAMRLPKDAFFVHQVMWDGWVEPERDRTYIVGHWNYDSSVRQLTKQVVSTGDEVELFLNGRSLGRGERRYQYLFTFRDIPFEEGRLEAVSYRGGREVSRYAVETAGKPHHLNVTTIENPQGFRADGADIAIVEFEVVDEQGRRCPLDNRMVHFQLWGEGQWLGGIATPQGAWPYGEQLSGAADADKRNAGSGQNAQLLDGPGQESAFSNYIRETSLPVECGVNRVLVRSTTTPGDISLCCAAEGLPLVTINMQTTAAEPKPLALNLSRGETPAGPSYVDVSQSVDIVSATCGSNEASLANSYDDNELSEWASDGQREHAWATYRLARKAMVNEVVLKLTGWRSKCYPLAVYAGKQKLWEGLTYATLGYVHIPIAKPVVTNQLTIRMLGPAQNSTAFGEIKELAGGNTGELDRIRMADGEVKLRIVEVEFHE